MDVYELNVDGLVGPTHNYSGLSVGNIASEANAHHISNPHKAAHQGIAKMRLLHKLGIKQGILPPHQRPNLQLLHELGFVGSPAEQINKAYKQAPMLLNACYSASNMWTANAATVSSSLDTLDNKVHFTAANLISNIHRHQEASFSHRMLQHLFSDEQLFRHHKPLPSSSILKDEGAANHNRLCQKHNTRGINVFVYGKRALPANNTFPQPKRYPARQTLEASEAIARKHQLHPNNIVFAAQNPRVIDKGVFHNDVIAVANESVLFLHQEAFLNQKEVLSKLNAIADFPLHIIEISSAQVSVEEAVNSYLFNSQLITLRDNYMTLITPIECQKNPQIKQLIEEIIADATNPIASVHYLDLKQSMRNGGGPACLRLRIPLTAVELEAVHQGILVTDALLDALDKWVDKYYRTQLTPYDFVDPVLIDELFYALDELTQLLNLGDIYPFQMKL